MHDHTPEPSDVAGPDTSDTTARPATADELDALVATLVDSHLDYVWERWALPDDDLRAEHLPTLYRADLEHVGLPHGSVWTTPGHGAVAVWLPAGAHGRLTDEAGAELDRVVADCFGERLRMVERAESAAAAVRPRTDWFLATMGTRRARQRRGLGTAVLEPMLARFDADGATAGLDTSEPGNLVFYGRLGFEVVASVPAVDDVPPIWIMRRDPHPRRDR
jgi:GNAT superfamily N-acetyltransferase